MEWTPLPSTSDSPSCCSHQPWQVCGITALSEPSWQRLRAMDQLWHDLHPNPASFLALSTRIPVPLRFLHYVAAARPP